jgi:AcrR family transcriptional regulator
VELALHRLDGTVLPMSLADPTRRDTRNAILDAAEEIVARMGVGNLTFDEIAREAGVSKGGVLYHFRSKEALTAAMIERFIERFDTAVVDAAASDREATGRVARAYVRATVGEPPLTGELFDRANGAITAAMANFPESLEPVRQQSARSQASIGADDTLDPVFATIIRLAIDGMWLAENFNLMRFDRSLKAAVADRLIAWTHLEELPSAAHAGGPDLSDSPHLPKKSRASDT